MSKSREIEAKTLLNKTVYAKLKIAFPLKTDFKQENYYFDTKKESLAQQKIGLRVRLFADRAEQTMKVPDPQPVQDKFHEVIEITDALALNQAQELIKRAQKGQTVRFAGNIGAYFAKHPSLKGKLHLITWSKTHRILAKGPQNCELTFDETEYPDHYQDFELEIENKNPALIKKTQSKLEKQFGFSQTKANSNQNKIARAFAHRLRA